jgi:hypothetical protein
VSLTVEMPFKVGFSGKALKGVKAFRCVFAGELCSIDEQTSCVPAERALASAVVVYFKDKNKNSRSVRP